MPGKAAKITITERQQEILQKGRGNLGNFDAPLGEAT